MLSIYRTSVAQAINYYSKDDYYLETSGVWQGAGAELLGLENQKIKEEDFKQMIKGKFNHGDEKISIDKGGKKNEHTAGADLTFSAPKSVSCMALVFGDERIKEAHNLAVSRVLDHIEQNLAQVRKKEKNNTISYEKTDNLTTAKFMHVSSRELDPQLHTHCVVMNFSKKENGDWRAFDYSEIFKNKKNLGMMYRNELAQQLQLMGYKIEFDSQGLFEIAGFNKELIQEFSKRSEQINERYEELKKQYPQTPKAELKAQATLETRKIKDEPEFEILFKQWLERSDELQLNKDNVIDKDYQLPPREDLTIQDNVKKALDILTRNEAVISQETLIATASNLDVGKYKLNEYLDYLKTTPDVVRLDNNKFTTHEIVAMEKEIIEAVIHNKNTVAPLVYNQEVIKSKIDSYQIDKGYSLTEGQRKSVEHILRSTDKILAVQGNAGSGKTTMLDALREINNDNVEILGLSFTGKAASEISNASGIEAKTLASFLNSKPSEPSTKQKLYVVDEASMISIQDMHKLIKRTEQENAKIVLIGDTKQLKSIGAGQIFETLQQKEAINTAFMTENIRQRDEQYKLAVNLMADSKAYESYLKLVENQKLIVQKDMGIRYTDMVQQYCKDHNNTILVTAQNSERALLNTMIRNELQKQNLISNENVKLVTHQPKLNSNNLDNFFINNYKLGDKVIKGKLEIDVIELDHQRNKIIGCDKQGTLHTIDIIKDGADLIIYTPQEKDFAIGEKIIFLRNDKNLGINNGNTGTIEKIEDGKLSIRTENDNLVTINTYGQYDYINHGYAITTYKSQGQTSKNLIYNADTKAKLDYNQIYVGISRGKDDITIYTDNKKKLEKSFSVLTNKTSTLDSNIKFNDTLKLDGNSMEESYTPRMK